MRVVLAVMLLLASVLWCRGVTTINSTNDAAYGADIGWVNWRGDANNGASIGEYVCSGSIYAANVGWICLGSGFPANKIYYQNAAANDYGINQDGLGNLRGLAYGANIGWVSFEDTGAPRVDLTTGNFSGCAYSANCGWISLSNAVAFVQTDQIAKGLDSNGLGMPDAWQLLHFGYVGVDPNGDPDGDGVSNLNEYLDGTDPLARTDDLRVTAYHYAFSPGLTAVVLTWTSVPSRQYRVEATSSLRPPTTWVDSGLGLITPDAGATTARNFVDGCYSMRFYRVRAVRPLDP